MGGTYERSDDGDRQYSDNAATEIVKRFNDTSELKWEVIDLEPREN